MHATNDRDQFAPPRPPGRMRAIALAVLAHAALIGALTWGVNWKSSSDQPAVEAELWSAVPQQAAPRAVEPPPPPAPAPTPAPEPAPAPPPPPPPPRPEQADTREADIALQQQKKRLEEEKKKREQQLEREKRERERKEEERRERLEQEKKERLLAQQKAEREKAEREKAEKEKAAKAEQDKQKKLAEDKRRKAEEAREAKEAEARRQENLRRMQGLAGATGGETATGTAQRSSGPSGSYGGKVAAKVRPNIVYPDTISGNPRAEVEVRAAPDGTIVGARITQSSGNKAWDDAVIRALHRTETLPRDVDGRVPSSLVIGFRPRD
ncbi:cell envelope integrity protein TolA [Diaphorobacter sp. C33]|uniref:Cell division and transport-associated protein TolA n=3 Tax=Diaphorobacter TaxID=238749 RepID=A0AAX1WVI9_9BURK|nr:MULTISPECIES: cell envelope integrity protein TolA [Diaphorobacter]ABM42914.1 Cell division and transport-associated protein TolA [Acidovorax sp. JS42]PZU42685.1 MAG: cell envelope integrity protein TolA [Acidovorax sp.]ACM33701.1 protein TolA [[Acidovorax] ebreus TPSY]ASI67525.1 protein TolA [Diaphorobacter nitroreducens]ROR47891.1 cell division and transport-associated protein TolA [Diaphorobacter nitroreducens]